MELWAPRSWQGLVTPTPLHPAGRRRPDHQTLGRDWSYRCATRKLVCQDLSAQNSTITNNILFPSILEPDFFLSGNILRIADKNSQFLQSCLLYEQFKSLDWMTKGLYRIIDMLWAYSYVSFTFTFPLFVIVDRLLILQFKADLLNNFSIAIAM